jgi:hypothetical protein
VVVVVNWILLPPTGSHSVRVKLLPMLALAIVHTVSSVGPVVIVLQVVAVQPLPEVAVTGVHEAAGVGPVLTVLQLVVV